MKEEESITQVPEMRIKTISVTYGRKANLGNYNSADASVSMWADVEEGADVQACFNELWAQAKDNVKAQLLPLMKQERAA